VVVVWAKQGLVGGRLALATFAGLLALHLLAALTMTFEADWIFHAWAILWLGAGATVLTFWRVRPLAGLLTLPHFTWMTLTIGVNLALKNLL
jgi:translocator protein